MAKHLDEIKGKQVPAWQQANPYYVEDIPYPARVQTKQKSSSTKSNHYKPAKSTKRGDVVGTGEYEVNKGDSLWKIAQQHGTTVDALRKANPEIKGNMIYAGQIINLGNKTTNTNTNTNTNTTKNNITESNNSNYKGTVFKNKTNTNINTNNNVNYQNQPNINYKSNGNLYNYIDDANDTPAISRLRTSLIFGCPSVKIKAKRLQNTKPSKSNTNKINTVKDLQQTIRNRNYLYRILDNR